MDWLLDIIINVPTLVSQTNALMDDPHPEQRDRELASIVKDFIRVVNKIHLWQHRTEIHWSKMPYWAVLSQMHNQADDKYPTKLFPFALEFDSLDSAILFSFKWSIQLQVFNKIIHIYRSIHANGNFLPELCEIFEPDVQQDSQAMCMGESAYINYNRISMSFAKAEADRLGRLLCQCVGYCYRTEMGTLGPQSCRYPQWVLRQFFRQNEGYERELEWVLKIKYMTGHGLYEKLELMEFEDGY